MDTELHVEASQTLPKNLLDSEYTQKYLYERVALELVDKMVVLGEITFKTTVTENADGSFTRKIEAGNVSDA
ncbi:hypothetical protein Xoosp13_361 [Xanthomonas phage Xoo-sp13]|nr:hypothetical protein Xoosp13_361 [Xanthomonas phage Xoo-sp13]